MYTSQKTLPRRDHGATPDFRFAYKHCRILHFLQVSHKNATRNFHVLLQKWMKMEVLGPPRGPYDPHRALIIVYKKLRFPLFLNFPHYFFMEMLKFH